MGTFSAPLVRRRTALAALSLVLFLTFLDNTIVSVVLADVQSDLHAGVSGLQWIVNGYALVFASFMLIFGTLGDLFGRKRVLLAGVAMFCAGSVMGALAPNVPTLIAARALMGLGAAASEPGTLSMIRHIYPDSHQRARAYGVWAAVSGLALAMGPVIGSTLAGVWSWRAIFWFNVFFGALAFAGAAWTLPENADRVRQRLDFVGFALGAAALACGSVAVISGETQGYLSVGVDSLFALGAAAAVAFVLYERRAANPMLNVGYFRIAAFSGSNVVALVTYFSTFAIFFFVALYLQVVGTLSAYSVGLDFLPMAVGMILAAVLTGRWVAVSGPRMAMFTGCVLGGVGVLLTDVNLSPSAGLSQIGWTMAIAGIGFGMAVVPVTSSAMAVIPPEHSGMAASMTNTSREMGAVAGVAILGSIVNGQLTVNLVRRLGELGIPKAFQQQVVVAVTTGTFNAQAAGVKSSPSVAVIVAEVLNAAYGAFAHGLDIALTLAGALMLACAVVALFTMRLPDATDAVAVPAG